jgi:DNA-binding MarR family transcriptional regulator
MKGALPAQIIRTFLIVAANEGASVGEIADMTGNSPTVVSRHLQDLSEMSRLKEDGLDLVSIKSDPLNLRRHIVVLTPKGKALFRRWVDLGRMASRQS